MKNFGQRRESNILSRYGFQYPEKAHDCLQGGEIGAGQFANHRWVPKPIVDGGGETFQSIVNRYGVIRDVQQNDCE